MQSNSDKNFDEWNPMVDDYKSKYFNTFVDGPGANLDEDLQPGAVASEQKKNNSYVKPNRYKLALKNVPKDMTRIAIRNLCSNYGKVLQVWVTEKTPVKFVTFATLNDMTRALTALKINKYGIIAEIAKERNPTNISSNNSLQQSGTNEILKSEEKHSNHMIASLSDQYGKENSTLSSKLDMNRRSIKGPFAKPQPINVNNEPFVTESNYENSNLKNVDIKRNFLLENDMHYQDRNNGKNKNDNNDDYNYGKQIYTGRSYYVESKETMIHLKKLSEISEGCYEPETNCYKKSSSKGDECDLILTKKCANCKKWASKMCEKCHIYYCSTECQKIDWQKHRSFCAKNRNEILKLEQPPLEDVVDKNHINLSNDKNDIKSFNTSKTEKKFEVSSESLLSSTDIQEISKIPIPMAKLPKSGCPILITTVSNPNSLYIRSLEKDDNINYVKILNLINSKSTNAKTLNKMPERGDICITDFQDTGNYRVLILNPINEQKIVVIYIDFGNIEEKKLQDLKEAPTDINCFKCYTIAVNLKNVPDFVPTQKLKDYLNEFVDSSDIDLKLVYDENENDIGNSKSIEVEIIDVTHNENLNEKILKLKEIPEPKEFDVPIYKFDIEYDLLPKGENIEVYVVDNSLLELACISCILQKDLIPLQELNKQLKEYAEKINGPYTPRQSELCVVKYDNEWYRAECLEVVGDENPAVLFIDYGNMLPIHISQIRKYPRELKCYPCKTSCCMIADLPEEIDEKLFTRLRELIPVNKKLIIPKINSEKLDEETNIIYLPEIIQKLKQEKIL